jgi:hypothetical protein
MTPGIDGDVQALGEAILPDRDLAAVQDPAERGVRAAAPAALEGIDERLRVVDGEVGAAPPGADFADFNDPRGDAKVLQPLGERGEGAPEIRGGPKR